MPVLDCLDAAEVFRHRPALDPSEALYRGMGWQPAGTIPGYARSADGTLHTTAFHYKLL